MVLKLEGYRVKEVDDLGVLRNEVFSEFLAEMFVDFFLEESAGFIGIGRIFLVMIILGF